MSDTSPFIRVHVNIDLPAASIQAVVAHSKRANADHPQGPSRLDSADALSALISKFLHEQGFADYAMNPDNY